jgi:hypothetical protein
MPLAASRTVCGFVGNFYRYMLVVVGKLLGACQTFNLIKARVEKANNFYLEAIDELHGLADTIVDSIDHSVLMSCDFGWFTYVMSSGTTPNHQSAQARFP